MGCVREIIPRKKRTLNAKSIRELACVFKEQVDECDWNGGSKRKIQNGKAGKKLRVTEMGLTRCGK